MTLQTLERKLKPLESPVKSQILKWLYLHLPPQPITNKRMQHAYSNAVSILMREIELGTIEQQAKHEIEKYLKTLVPFVEEYEKKEFPVESATPEDILRFLMEQNECSQYDLADDLGGQPVVSDILNDKRKLTREHIERLSKRFNISPASFYPF
ncbi:MAG: helix-turn-helix domain-containing protein, partial [Elusimicrobia bacterium]|nr:helix-turn-helix domain-containing protein [Elusimicrobiota bacterium]